MGRKLTIYMLDGIATGSKTVEIGNWSGKAIYSPRASLKKILERGEFENPGIYFLKNQSSVAEYNDNIYIGEAEELRARLKQHIAERDFEAVICFMSKDDMLTKAHIKYVESRLISIAKSADSSEIDNSNQPKLSRLSEADVSDMEYFIEQIQLILPTVGIQTLVSTVQHSSSLPVNSEKQKEYRIKSKSFNAVMVESEDSFIVLKGSEANRKTSKSISKGWLKIRNKLQEDGVLSVSGENLDKLIFSEDTTFSSPSAASSVILGRQAPGPVSWVDSKGLTYKVIQENTA